MEFQSQKKAPDFVYVKKNLVVVVGVVQLLDGALI